MTRIGPSDQLLILLEERLKTLGKDRAGKAATTPRRTSGPPIRTGVLAAFDGLDPDERRRTIVRGLLIQRLGDGIANDPALTAIAADVARIIADDEQGSALLDRALAQLSPPA